MLRVTIALATILSFCPHSDTSVIGYTCNAYAVQLAPEAPHLCTECGFCDIDVCNLDPNMPSCQATRTPAALACTVDPNAGTITIAAEPPDTLVMFRARPLYKPNTTVCDPCACFDVWWIPDQPGSPCVCPSGGC